MGLRFAPLVRVSTEKQERKGESLNVQKQQIEEAVKSLGGTIIGWQYCGQEHATPEYDRALLDRLLADSSKNLFDAVIVTHPDRWSRDNLKSAQGLQILRDNGIKFYVLNHPYDLENRNDKFFISMSA